MASLREQWQKTIKNEGGHCPTCDRWGRIYGRNINKTMATSLLWLTQAPADKDGWVDVPTRAPRWLVRSNQLPTLKWWGLVERKPVDAKSKNKHSGMWRVTDKGKDFALGTAFIPKTVFTYNDTVQFVSPEHVQMKDCFKDYFDYKELMNSYYPGAIK